MKGEKTQKQIWHEARMKRESAEAKNRKKKEQNNE